MTHSVLASAVNHPDAINPYIGLFNQRIVQSFMRHGMDVDVVSPRPFAPPVGPHSEYSMLPTVEEWDGYSVHHPRFFYLLPKRLFYGRAGDSFAKRIPRYVERTFDVPDVIHACHIYLDGYGMVDYCEKHNVPLFVVSHGHFMNEYEELADGVREKVDETLGAAEKVLCVSDALAEKAAERVPRSKVEVVPIGATPSRYPVERKAALREELGVDPEATVALFVGEFCERKGIPELAEVLPDLDLPNTEFVFVGHGGDEEWTLRRALASSRFSARHVYTGITSMALRRWLAVADVLVLPSHAEGRPTVIYEAMAAETAVLSTTVGGVPEQVEDGETGVLIPPGDTDRLREALTALAGDRERLLEMGRKGRERLVEQGWTWDDHAERVYQLHREALE
ncbi:glycosyltransferase [Halogeometricum pallidum JCM 14848]|uniref:Glycosyltransferase n=1 Tax=Halogeometricum pallidum JCM 14848 TaxID=1227487 RepID=M0DFC8_HALPD|nr:glycosyltransferase [Halogeometricum pallidum]ELZ33432.1 glycosyltransferase [Halogeometricum pallidum JCM 14848]